MISLTLALAAQTAARRPGEAAASLSLHLPQAQASAPPPLTMSPSLDSPIEQLIADPRAKAVLDRDLPGMSEDANLDKFKAMSLKQLQPQTGGQLTDELLAKVAADLAGLDGAASTATAPVVKGRNRDVGR